MKRIRISKKYILMLVAAVLVTLVLVSGTLAATSAAGYIATNEMAAKTLQVNVSENLTVDTAGAVPGDTLDKDSTSFTVSNTGNTPAYIRVTVRKYWLGSETSAKDSSLDTKLMELKADGAWLTASGGIDFSSGETDVFYYGAPVSAGSSVQLPMEIKISTEADNDYINSGIQLDVTVDAVQFVSGENELNANGILSSFGVVASLNGDGSINSLVQ